MASRWRPLLAHRRRREPPWVVATVAAPQLPPQSLTVRRRRPLVRRSQFTVPIGGVLPAPPSWFDPAVRRRAVPARRRRVFEPVWPQQVAQAPAFVAAAFDPARRVTVPRRRRAVLSAPPWPQQAGPVAPAFVPSALEPAQRRPTPRPRRSRTLVVPEQPRVPLQPARRPVRSLATRRGEFFTAPRQLPPGFVPQQRRQPTRCLSVRRGHVSVVFPAAAAPTAPGFLPAGLRPRGSGVPAVRHGVFRPVPLVGAPAPVVTRGHMTATDRQAASMASGGRKAASMTSTARSAAKMTGG